MQLLKQDVVSTGFISIDLPAGNYRGLFLRVSGTNAAGDTLTLADLGVVKLVHQQYGERINTQFYFWNERTNILGGVPEATSNVGAAFAFSAIVDFRKKFDKQNILKVVTSPKTTLTWDSFSANFMANIATGTFEVYALYDNNGYERYLPFVQTHQVQAAAAGQITEVVPQPFVEECWGEHDANITRVQLWRDGQTWNDGLWLALMALSNATNEVETGVTTVEMVAPVGHTPANVMQTKFQLQTSAALSGNVFTYHYYCANPYNS